MAGTRHQPSVPVRKLTWRSGAEGYLRTKRGITMPISISSCAELSPGKLLVRRSGDDAIYNDERRHTQLFPARVDAPYLMGVISY
jgi:hypothetical protein